MERQWIKVGRVAHYYSRLGVVSVAVEKIIRPGDRLRIVGLTTDFELTVQRIERNKERIDQALPGDRIGLESGHRAGPGDEVYRLADKES